MAVLLLISLMLLIIVSDRRHDRREIAKRPLPRTMQRERRGRPLAPSAPISNVIALRPAATKAKHQQRLAKVISLERVEIARDR